MRRLILIAFLTLFAVPAFALTDAESAMVKKAETYLNGIATLKARFTQVNADGSSHEGDLYISRPGKMRLVYDPPTPMLMVADGVFLIYVDKDMDDVSHIDLNDTPAGLLLKANLSFTDAAVKLISVKQGPGTVEITATQTKDTAAGKLTFVFADGPFELKQWRVVDAQNKEVRVTLSNTVLGGKLDSKLFKYDARKESRGTSDRD